MNYTMSVGAVEAYHQEPEPIFERADEGCLACEAAIQHEIDAGRLIPTDRLKQVGVWTASGVFVKVPYRSIDEGEPVYIVVEPAS